LIEIEDNLLDIPKGWILTTLEELSLQPKSDIVDGPFGSNLKASEYVDKGIPIIRLQNIERNLFINQNIKFINPHKAQQLLRHSFINGDIVITKLGEPLGKACIIPDFLEMGIIVADLVRLRTDDKYVSKQYLVHLINSIWVSQQLQKQTKGTTRPRVNLQHIRKLQVFYPPLNEQKRIVTKIEALQTKSTAAKQQLQQIKPLLDKFRQSVLAAAFHGDLTKTWREQNPDVEPASELIKSNCDLESSNLPVNWCKALVGNVVDNFKYGTSKKCTYEAEGIPILRIPNVVDGSIDRSDLKYAKLPDKEFDTLRLIPGDILMIRSNGSVSLVGKTAIVSESERNFAYAGYLIRLRPNKNLVDSEYLNLWFSSYEIRLQIEIPLRSTSGVNNINSDETKRLNIPIPPLQEQKEIVRRIEALFKLADAIAQQYQQAETNLETLNQSILAKAFRGELVPQDPNDEPASVLLERIKAEKTKQEATGKKTKKKNSKDAKVQQLNLDL
jgi:type I restriction enzyme, S subunit